ncbi:DUF6531 domain-containing protein [Pararhizobium sp. LjRoot238]|uniref:DUF6531 domain-containing protein n=1 Tax=Pararhizobium sp. LjRoot238 TaxID=3342293 RepID=UPI003ECD9E4F
MPLQPPPLRNESVVGAHVYSHSGEFSPEVLDLELPGRGLSFRFLRKYRSALAHQAGLLGRGWSFEYARRIEQAHDDVLYYDERSRVSLFTASKDAAALYAPGFYGVLVQENDRFVLKQRFGEHLIFELPQHGGRLLAVQDRNLNTMQFAYADHEIVVIDSLGRHIVIRLEANRVVETRDHTGRHWQYRYNHDGCLTEVVHPGIRGINGRRCTKYCYDAKFRLLSITDPKGQTFLRNAYDEAGRVNVQQHGGGAFRFQYDAVSTSPGSAPVYWTRVTLKNGGVLELLHDGSGQVLQRTLPIRKASLRPADRLDGDDMVALTTTSRYNENGELVQRSYPAGNSAEWVYDEANNDPRARGNLLEVRQLPALGSGENAGPLVTRSTYEPMFQQLSSRTDARGNTTQYEYDSRGNVTARVYPVLGVHDLADGGRRGMRTLQLTARYKYNNAGQIITYTDARGASIQYFYYPERGVASSSAGHLNTLVQTAGGYLARVVRDAASDERRMAGTPASLTSEFEYDERGNLVSIIDGKGRPTRLEYDELGNLVGTISREPFEYRVSFDYDANGNMVECSLKFGHHAYDDGARQVNFVTSEIRERFEFNTLNNIVKRVAASGTRQKAHTFVRDAAENVVREVEPLGNIIEYDYDEHHHLLVRRFGVGSESVSTISHTYTPNGSLRETIDARGNTTTHNYDAYHRYEGYTNALGTSKKQWRDAVGNVVRVQIFGATLRPDPLEHVVDVPVKTLAESWLEFDELNRRVRVDRAWRDAVTDAPLGNSQYDGRKGVVSSVVQYGEGHLPVAVWSEAGNTVRLDYDGAGRVTDIRDDTGETLSIEYDENSNARRVSRLDPTFHHVVDQQFDEMDRVVARAVNDGTPQLLAYNALNSPTDYRDAAGATVVLLQDTFGLFGGLLMRASGHTDTADSPAEQELVHRFEWDDNARLVTSINARGNATRYHYDALNRLSSIAFADGVTTRFQRDPGGNVLRMTRGDHEIFANRFDVLNRLIERTIQTRDDEAQVETVQYDNLDRVMLAASAGISTRRHFDSLSRVLSESQSGRTIHYSYDSAGNQIQARYSDNYAVDVSFDQLRRPVDVAGPLGPVASFTYRSSTQVDRVRLGEGLRAVYDYEPETNWLARVVYRAQRTGTVSDGAGYSYGAGGRRLQEVHLRRSDDAGERYFYDSAHRPMRAQYGVLRLSDPNSPFDRDVLYQLGPTGLWQRRTVRDGALAIVAQDVAEATSRERYSSVGNNRFTFDGNGNRIAETRDQNGVPAERRYLYDYANRLVRVEDLGHNGETAQTIEYAYDVLSRQILKRVTKSGESHTYTRVWSGYRLIEEWRDGTLVTRLVYGGPNEQPLAIVRNTREGERLYYYAYNGRNLVSSILDGSGGALATYEYDFYRRPRVTDERPDADGWTSSLTTLFVGPNLMWDSDAELAFSGAAAHDLTVGERINSPSRTSFDEAPSGAPNVSSVPPKQTPSGFPPGTASALGALGATIGALGVGIAIGGILTGPGELVVGPAGFAVSGVGILIGGVGALIGYVDALGDDPFGENGPIGFGPFTRPGQFTGPSDSVQFGSFSHPGGGSHGDAGNSSGGGEGSSSGQPEDRPFGNGIDYGHEGGAPGNGSGSSGGSSGSGTGSGSTGGSTGSSGSSSGQTQKEHKPVLNNNGEWVYEDTGEPVKDEDKKDAGAQKGGSMPNPIDGTGEGIDKDWWRNLPNASALSVAAALRSPLKYDEREGTPYLQLGAASGSDHLVEFLSPHPVTVDEGGEGITINVNAVHSTGLSTGSNTADGWGDKPRTLAEAVAAPRIRGGALSRF